VLPFLLANGLAVAGVAVVALVSLAVLTVQLIPDTWLMLVSGREVAQHGPPHHDTLFVLTQGREWVDQQWLAQLAYYGAFAGGGIRSVLLLNTCLFVAAAAAATAFALRRGASPRSVFLFATLLPLIAPWAMQVRAQTLAELLFVLVFGLLTLESPLTGRRVAAVLGLLVLWANVHGTVVMGAVLALLCGTFAIVRPRGAERRPGLALLLSPLCVFASPYTLELGSYYRRLLTNPQMSKFVAEWKPSTPGALTAVFYAVLLYGIWLLGRHGRHVRRFDKLALLLLAVSGLTALRSIIWFGFAALILLAPLVERSLGGTRMLTGPVAGRLGLAAGVLAVIVAVPALARPSDRLEQYWPAAASARVAELAAQHPNERVFADDHFADWLVWNEPELRGRIAYDVRYELLHDAELNVLSDYHDRRGDDWRRAASGYDLYVLHPNSAECPRLCEWFYGDENVIVAAARR
jgi:hypothetical protein